MSGIFYVAGYKSGAEEPWGKHLGLTQKWMFESYALIDDTAFFVYCENWIQDVFLV